MAVLLTKSHPLSLLSIARLKVPGRGPFLRSPIGPGSPSHLSEEAGVSIWRCALCSKQRETLEQLADLQLASRTLRSAAPLHTANPTSALQSKTTFPSNSNARRGPHTDPLPRDQDLHCSAVDREEAEFAVVLDLLGGFEHFHIRIRDFEIHSRVVFHMRGRCGFRQGQKP